MEKLFLRQLAGLAILAALVSTSVLPVEAAPNNSRPAAGVRAPTSGFQRPGQRRDLTDAASGTVTINASSPGATISRNVRGANEAMWFDITQSGLVQEFETAGLASTRWPGGSGSDKYHWATNSACYPEHNYVNPNSTFDNFMNDFAIPAGLSPWVTLNYGTNATCTAGGDPSEAAAWVKYANITKHYGVKYWTVGNESFAPWETDLHSIQHDPTTYANAVAGSGGYYSQIKAVDPTAQVGVVVAGTGGPCYYFPGWDPTVLKHAKYDFVEFHCYPQGRGNESDQYLVQQAATDVANSVASLRKEMTSYNVPASVPIFVGELGSVSTAPGKQSTSITQALYAGQLIANLMTIGVQRATWWDGNPGCEQDGNFSSSLYGWQNFGGFMIFSDGIPEYGPPGKCNTNVPTIPRGTLLPTASVYKVLANFGSDGGTMLASAVSQSLPLVRAYGATRSGGYSVLLFNLDQANAANVTVTIAHATGSSYNVQETVYDKSLYDASKNNVWSAPVTTTSKAISPTFSLTLSPWSVTVVNLTS